MSRRTRKNVGIIGLGIIGSRVREVLRNKGYHVFVWNRTPRPVPNFVGAPAELAEMCDHLQIFVSDDDALQQVVKQVGPGLSARNVVLAHSTVSPQTIVSVADLVQRRGARFVEAPFTGSKEAAEKGELVYYAGGEEAAVQEVLPLLQASSKQVLEIGTIGQATAIKLATNMVTAASIQSAAEALAVVQSAGVPLEKFAAAMKNNASNSATLSMKLPKMIEGNFEPHFSVKHMLKDMQIANRLGLSHHLELGVSSAARDRLLEQMQRGHGDEDYSIVIRKYFPEVATAGSGNGLDLFSSVLPSQPMDGVQPVAEEIPTNPMEEQTGSAPIPFPEETESAPGPTGSAELEPRLGGPGEPSPELIEPIFSEEPLPEDHEQRRSFFSRLLRR